MFFIYLAILKKLKHTNVNNKERIPDEGWFLRNVRKFSGFPFTPKHLNVYILFFKAV